MSAQFIMQPSIAYVILHGAAGQLLAEIMQISIFYDVLKTQ